MKPITQYLPQLAGSFFLIAIAMSPVIAQGLPAKSHQETDDPARWYQEDLTPQARFQTSKKEAEAAYKEAVVECKQLAPANRGNCLSDARNQLVHDLESAKKKTLIAIPK